MKSIVLPFLLLTVLTASFHFLVQAEGGYAEIPALLERVGVSLPQRPEISPIPVPEAKSSVYTSGNSRFSQGRCTTNNECAPAGCSGEVCSNNPGEVITTCEFSASFPNARGLTCQCLPQGVCGWE